MAERRHDHGPVVLFSTQRLLAPGEAATAATPAAATKSSPAPSPTVPAANATPATPAAGGSGARIRRMRSRAQWRFTAVGRVARRQVSASMRPASEASSDGSVRLEPGDALIDGWVSAGPQVRCA